VTDPAQPDSTPPEKRRELPDFSDQTDVNLFLPMGKGSDDPRPAEAPRKRRSARTTTSTGKVESPQSSRGKKARRPMSFPPVLFVVILLVLAVGSFLWRVQFFQPPLDSTLPPGEVESGALVGPSPSPSPPFTPRSAPLVPADLEGLRRDAQEALQSARRGTPPHPSLVNQLQVMEQAFASGVRELQQGSWLVARASFDSVLRLSDQLQDSIREKLRAEDFLARVNAAISRNESSAGFESTHWESFARESAQMNAAFTAGQFLEVTDSAELMLRRLAEWERRRDTALASALLAGRQALNAGRRPQAESAFDQALTIDTDSTEAKQGLSRLKTLEEVFELAQRARRIEAEGDLSGALALWQEAFRIDPLFGQAQQNVNRIQAQIRRNDWTAAREEARAAGESGNWQQAVNLYQRIERNFPEFAPEIEVEFGNARQRLARLGIDRALVRGDQLEAANRWREALEHYREAQRQFPAEAQLRQRIERASDILRSLIRFETMLNFAREAAAAGEFRQATDLFNEAVAAKPSVVPLGRAGEELQQLLRQQSQPIEIRITSDNRTLVSIPGYLPPERFRTRSLTILPGNYTIRGTRSNHRDVVIELKLRAGESVPTINVSANQRL
jgi:hypothetical protein